MSLPIIEHALFEHKLTGLNKLVKFRAFTNKEQKILLLAKEAKDGPDFKDRIVDAIRQIVSNCTLGKVDVANIPMFDLEDLFLRIRAKSISEISTIRYRYDYEDDKGAKKSEFVDVNVNLDDVKVQTTPGHTTKIQLNDAVGVIMKYPTFDMIKDLTNKDDVMTACIDKIYTDKEVFNVADYSKEEFEAFVESIDTKSLLKIKEFFETSPVLKHTVNVKPKNANGEAIPVTLQGISDFFT